MEPTGVCAECRRRGSTGWLPTAGDWNGIIVNSGGSLELERVSVRYAYTALTTNGGAVAKFSRALLMPCVDIHTVSLSPSHSHTVPCDSMQTCVMTWVE